MKLFIIFNIVFLIVLVLWLFLKKRKNKIKNIEISFEDIDSLNVSKIVKEENDIDFIRNQFWFEYKNRKQINLICFNKLKYHFEKENNVTIDSLCIDNAPTITTTDDLMTYIEIIISDEQNPLKIAQSFYIIEINIYKKNQLKV